MSYHRLTDSEIEARRAIQCFLAHIGDPGFVFEEEELVPGGPGTPDGRGGFLKTALYQTGAREVRILLHKKEWDPKQQYGHLWWRAVRLQHWPNRDNLPRWREFEAKPAAGDVLFRYEFVEVERAPRPIELVFSA